MDTEPQALPDEGTAIPLRGLTELPQSAELAGRIYADLEKSGQPISPADPMIAAIAMAYSGLHQQTVGY